MSIENVLNQDLKVQDIGEVFVIKQKELEFPEFGWSSEDFKKLLDKSIEIYKESEIFNDELAADFCELTTFEPNFFNNEFDLPDDNRISLNIKNLVDETDNSKNAKEFGFTASTLMKQIKGYAIKHHVNILNDNSKIKSIADKYFENAMDRQNIIDSSYSSSEVISNLFTMSLSVSTAYSRNKLNEIWPHLKDNFLNNINKFMNGDRSEIFTLPQLFYGLAYLRILSEDKYQDLNLNESYLEECRERLIYLDKFKFDNAPLEQISLEIIRDIWALAGAKGYFEQLENGTLIFKKEKEKIELFRVAFPQIRRFS